MTETMNVHSKKMKMKTMNIHRNAPSNTDICQLPMNCISSILSLTTPQDACICSIASSALRSAADSDDTWECFLPPDYRSFLSRAVEPVQYASKKDLFRKLCDRHILIDDGNMSFGLEKSKGAKCFMVSARALQIASSENKRCWKWIHISNSRFFFFVMKQGNSISRFSEAIKLRKVRHLKIHHKMKCRVLSAHTAYVAYLIYKIDEGRDKFGTTTWLGNILQESTVIMHGITVSKHWVCLDPKDMARDRFTRIGIIPGDTEKIGPDVRVPEERGDGWKEVEMGTFYNHEGIDDDQEVEVRLMEIRNRRHKSGLQIQGIEFRPLKDQSSYRTPSSCLDDDLIVELLGNPDDVNYCFPFAH